MALKANQKETTIRIVSISEKKRFHSLVERKFLELSNVSAVDPSQYSGRSLLRRTLTGIRSLQKKVNEGIACIIDADLLIDKTGVNYKWIKDINRQLPTTSSLLIVASLTISKDRASCIQEGAAFVIGQDFNFDPQSFLDILQAKIKFHTQLLKERKYKRRWKIGSIVFIPVTIFTALVTIIIPPITYNLSQEWSPRILINRIGKEKIEASLYIHNRGLTPCVDILVKTISGGYKIQGLSEGQIVDKIDSHRIIELKFSIAKDDDQKYEKDLVLSLYRPGYLSLGDGVEKTTTLLHSDLRKKVLLFGQ